MKQVTLDGKKDDNLRQLFSTYLEKESIFQNKEVLKTTYDPGKILHRDEQVNELASILAPSLKDNNPSNLFVYGKTGTGKTLVVRHVTRELQHVATSSERSLHVVYVNCKKRKVADTDYRLIAQLARELGEDIPATGLPTQEVYTRFVNTLEEQGGVVILILDEIDALVNKISDNFLYNLTRLNEELEQTRISLIGISNDLNFTEYMDARVKSSLSEEEILFRPYNAIELQDILRQRADIAFEGQTLEGGVIEKCAAIAAHEHGDARRAIDLLRVSGELAERSDTTQITIEHVDHAHDKIEKDRVIETIKTLPRHSKIVLYTLVDMCNHNGGKVETGDVYEQYQSQAKDTNTKPLTQRRISDLIGELDLLGIINAKVISHGRYGRTRQITLDLEKPVIEEAATVLKNTIYR